MAKKITVDWTDPSPTTYLDHLEVWRKTGSGGTYAQLGGDISIGTETYSDESTLADGQEYFYQVRAYNASGDYSSVEASVTISGGGGGGTPPATPTIIALMEDNTAVDTTNWSLIWTSDFATDVGKMVGVNGVTVSVNAGNLEWTKAGDLYPACAVNHAWVNGKKYRVEVDLVDTTPTGKSTNILYTWLSPTKSQWLNDDNPRTGWLNFTDGQETTSLDTCMIQYLEGVAGCVGKASEIRLYEEL